MYEKILKMAIFVWILILIAGSGTVMGQTQHKEEPQQNQVQVDEDVLDEFMDEPIQQFHSARESFLKRDVKTAASEIRKGAAFLKLEAGRAEGDTKKALLASIKELEDLEDKVEKGTVHSAKEMDDVFARAHQALADHHYVKASESWTKKAITKTGHHLKAAAVHLENAMAWSGQKVEQGTASITKEAHSLGDKMVKGAGWVLDQAASGLKNLGEEIKNLGHKIKPEKKETTS
jgi:hypothetical protein